GQYLGLGDPRRAAQAIRLCWLIGAGIMTAMGVVFIVAPQPLTRLIAPDEPALYETAATLLRIAGPVQFFFGSYLVLSHALRGAGDTRTAMLLTYASTFLLRLPGAWLMGYVLDLGLTGVWFALAGELVVRGGLFMTRFFHGGWRRIEV
ncbi:MAG TPA: MATE family efflux transporter, partial [Phycisphaeraceae bacterium]